MLTKIIPLTLQDGRTILFDVAPLVNYFNFMIDQDPKAGCQEAVNVMTTVFHVLGQERPQLGEMAFKTSVLLFRNVEVLSA